MKISALGGRLLAIAISAFSFSTMATVSITELSHKKIYDVTVEEIEVENKTIAGQNFSAPKLKGVDGYAGVNYQIGQPNVPVIRFDVRANQISDIKVITTNLQEEKIFPLAIELAPVLAPVEKIKGAEYQITKAQKKSDGSPYPSDKYSIKKLGKIRGQNIFQVTLYPVQFYELLNELKITRSYRLEVTKNEIEEVSGKEGILFIVGPQFKNASSLTQYIDKKLEMGFEVMRMDIQNLNPDQIRTRIKALYKSKPQLKYVLIIGDQSDVPAHTSSNINGVTDHYYASIDSNDYQSDIATPDLFVGRISASNISQLDTILLKYTRYIKGDFARNGWIGNLSFLATDDRWQLAEGTHNYVINSYSQSRGYTGNFPEPEQKGGDRLYAITHSADNRSVMDAFVQGRNIIDYSGHGATTFWDAPRVSQEDVRSLSYSALPFVISNACITGDFRIPESFAETWQRQEWGAVMFWGSMDSTFWDEDDILEKRMFDGLFIHNMLTFGPMTNYALAEMSRHYGGQGKSNYYWETYHLFGDPSLNLRVK